MAILTNKAKAVMNQKWRDFILAAAPVPAKLNPNFNPKKPESETNPRLIPKYTESRWLCVKTMQLWNTVIEDGRNKKAKENIDSGWED